MFGLEREHRKRLAHEVLKLNLICMRLQVPLDDANAMYQHMLRTRRFLSVFDAIRLTQVSIFMSSPERN